MNRVRDQLLAGAGFSLYKNGGIGWRHSFNLFEHRYQRRTIAYDPLESALVGSLIAAPESVVRSHINSGAHSHKGPPLAPDARFRTRPHLSKAARTLPAGPPGPNRPKPPSSRP